MSEGTLEVSREAERSLHEFQRMPGDDIIKVRLPRCWKMMELSEGSLSLSLAITKAERVSPTPLLCLVVALPWALHPLNCHLTRRISKTKSRIGERTIRCSFISVSPKYLFSAPRRIAKETKNSAKWRQPWCAPRCNGLMEGYRLKPSQGQLFLLGTRWLKPGEEFLRGAAARTMVQLTLVRCAVMMHLPQVESQAVWSRWHYWEEVRWSQGVYIWGKGEPVKAEWAWEKLAQARPDRWGWLEEIWPCCSPLWGQGLSPSNPPNSLLKNLTSAKSWPQEMASTSFSCKRIYSEFLQNIWKNFWRITKAMFPKKTCMSRFQSNCECRMLG